jgi:hypothetical protein
MAARFAVVTEEEIAKIKEDSIPKKNQTSYKIWFKNISRSNIKLYVLLFGNYWLRRSATQSRV